MSLRKRKNRNDIIKLNDKIKDNLTKFINGEWVVGNEVIHAQKSCNLFSKSQINDIKKKKHCMDIIKRCNFDPKDKIKKLSSINLNQLRATIILGAFVNSKSVADKIVNNALNVNFEHNAIDRIFYLKSLNLKNREKFCQSGFDAILNGKVSVFNNYKPSKSTKTQSTPVKY